MVTWHAPLQTFDALRQTCPKWRRKNALSELLYILLPKQRIVYPNGQLHAGTVVPVLQCDLSY